jgi:hypothetical protein
MAIKSRDWLITKNKAAEILSIPAACVLNHGDAWRNRVH